APALGALEARVGGIARVALEGGHADDRLRGLERARLHVGARQLAPEAAGAPLRHDPQHLHGILAGSGSGMRRSDARRTGAIEAVIVPSAPCPASTAAVLPERSHRAPDERMSPRPVRSQSHWLPLTSRKLASGPAEETPLGTQMASPSSARKRPI